MSTGTNEQPLGQSTLNTYLARAQAMAGVAVDSDVFFEDFSTANLGVATNPPPGWANASAGGGAISMTAAGRGGGWMRLSSNAVAAATGEADTAGTLISNVSTARWYAAVKFAINTAVDAQARCGIGVFNLAGTRSIEAGFFGNINAANFIVQYDGLWSGAGIDLGVAVDTLPHVAEFYGRGSTTLLARLDGGNELSAVMALAPADVMTGFDGIAKNGTTAANRSIDIDWVLCVASRT